jgi:flagellar M-ring protein FliF
VVDNPGRIRRLTAAIVVNDRLMQPATKNHAAVWQPRPADELRNLTALAQASVGFDTARGDVVTVEDLAFDENLPQPSATLSEQVLKTAEGSPNLIKYLALLMGLLVVVAFGLRPAIRRAGGTMATTGSAKAARREQAAAVAAPAQAQLSPSEPEEIDPERQRTQEIYEQVTTHLKKEPTQSSRLLQSWIHSD